MKAPIVEIFQTIQGEGKSVGKPSVFVRFWGCNLRCRFKGIECDTPYAVYKEKDKSLLLSPEEVVDRIKKLKTKHIVWTGGEPTMFQDFIIDVMNMLRDYTAEVETNGTIPITPKFDFVINQFNVSLKLKSSNQMEGYDKKRINNNALKTFNPRYSYFKFVVSNIEDIKEIEKITKQYPAWEIWLMPEGFKREEVIKHSKEVVKICIEKGYNFSPREHIIIWDFKRGK